MLAGRAPVTSLPDRVRRRSRGAFTAPLDQVPGRAPVRDGSARMRLSVSLAFVTEPRALSAGPCVFP